MRQREDTPREEHPFNEVSVGGIDSGALLSRRKALKLGGVATLGGAFGLFGSQEQAHARRRRRRLKLGASNPDINPEYANSSGDTRIAQSFINPRSGRLSRVQIKVRKFGSIGDYLFQINVFNQVTGLPTNTVLASTTVADRLVPSDTGEFKLVTANFATPAQVVAGTYALVVSRPGSDNLTLIMNKNIYQDGDFFSSAAFTPSFANGSPYDLIFWTYIS